MYDVLTRSAIFGIRNANKISNGDTGRVFADVGQFTNAAKAAANLDNTLGRGAQAAITAIGKVANNNKALNAAVKGTEWASKNVNPLLIGAAGYRVLKAKNKERALKREIWGMSTMFGTEAITKEALKSPTFLSFKNSICKTPTQKAICSILEGVAFVGASIAGSTTGYKIGEMLYPDKDKNSKMPMAFNSADADKIDESEYFILKNNKALA